MKYITSLILIYLCFSCYSEFEEETQGIVQLLSYYEQPVLLSKKAYLFVPIEGCGSCIQKSVQFIKKNTANHSIQFIVNSSSQKNISIQFDESVISKSNFICDTKNLSLQYQLVTTRPVLFVCEKGDIKYRVNIDDSNSEQVLKNLLIYANN